MPRKFEILERAPEYPHKCAITGLVGPVVDMDKFIPDFGRVYIHVSVIAAMAEKLGFLTDKDAAALRDEVAAAHQEADRAPAVLALFEEEINGALARARDRSRGVDPVGGDDGDSVARVDGEREGAGGDGGSAGASGGSSGDDERDGVLASAADLFDRPAVPSE